MRVHNLVKDLVIQKVEEMFLLDKTVSALGLSNTLAVKMDVVCYVLNRIPPQYVVSGRGLAYNETQDYREKTQRWADITRLVKEGMESVAKNRREREDGTFDPSHEGRFFNFPSFIGRLFDGINFEPLHDVDVSLLYEGKLVQVIDPNWQNPYKLVTNTAGTYLFWPHPVPAGENETQRTFQLELAVDDLRYEPLYYLVELNLVAANEFVDFVNTTESFRVKDLYLFPREDSIQAV